MCIRQNIYCCVDISNFLKVIYYLKNLNAFTDVYSNQHMFELKFSQIR
jgi:hypothetical protein